MSDSNPHSMKETDDGTPNSRVIRLARLEHGDGAIVGFIDGDEVVEITMSWHEALAALADGRGLDVRRAAGGRRITWTEAALMMPLLPGSEVHCVGLNYRAHAAEASELVDAPRADPIIFAKSYRSMTRPAATLSLPQAVSGEFDWEVELGVVIGKDAINIAPDEAWSYVAGYCVVNDITARDIQKLHQQWHLGKNIPASTPIGPWVVGREGFPVPPDLEVVLRINGKIKQHAFTSQLIHDVPALVSLLSRTTSLRVGDIIATGTPQGVGFARQPPEFLRDGDFVETEVIGVGRLTNVIDDRVHPAAAPRPGSVS